MAALVKPPKGQRAGRPSKSLTLEQAIALMDAARGTRLEAYITLSLLTGLRTEEARALRWDHVAAWAGDQWQPVTEAGFDHGELALFVWRSDRAGSDTKTPFSGIKAPPALRPLPWKARPARAGPSHSQLPIMQAHRARMRRRAHQD